MVLIMDIRPQCSDHIRSPSRSIAESRRKEPRRICADAGLSPAKGELAAGFPAPEKPRILLIVQPYRALSTLKRYNRGRARLRHARPHL